jgi:D-alanyl-D-alanine dipeptidase
MFGNPYLQIHLCMKTYQAIPINECQDPLVAIPATPFIFTHPHPYAVLGAPYGEASPWWLRQGVLDALLQAHIELDTHKPGWRLKLFDAYRPIPVQAFMVWREFRVQAELAGFSLAAYQNPTELEAGDPKLYEMLAIKVFEFWGIPSDNPLTPPPHSTGAAIDLTLQDESGQEVDMGCSIDETTARAYPDYFAQATTPSIRAFHEHRMLLNEVMTSVGFSRHGTEWWHFSLGDQMWAWTRGESTAIYGHT